MYAGMQPAVIQIAAVKISLTCRVLFHHHVDYGNMKAADI